MNKTGIITDLRYLEHLPGPGHPESHRRLETLYAMLREPDMNGHFIQIAPRMAEQSQILLNHTPEYVRQVAATRGKEILALTADTHASAGSYHSALLAVGGMFKAIEEVVSGRFEQVFLLQRPPGHHAERSRAMGFCIFNNAALGAHFARKELGLRRVLIVDWDVHHGNGTQHAFEDDPSVIFFSVHQFPHYPGTGLFTEAGRGKGEGFTINVPLSKGYGDNEYVAIFEKLLKPVVFEFAPELILVSAGFDIHGSDPMGGMKVTPEGFAGLTRSILNIAETCCGGKVVFCLEGGYNLNVLRESAKAVLMEISGQTFTDIQTMADKARRGKLDYALKRCRHVHQHFWKSL